ncbi:MAG: hypothetical protein KC441_18230 [Anaerolineales bacterium]|nr:hypothetical protein [Anaerolineales bacterium]
MSETISERIQRDTALIDQLLAAYANLFLQVKQKPPDLVQVTALASVLHSFYNGLESIFVTIAKEVDGTVPTGDRWHRELLEQMGSATEFRDAVLPLPLRSQIQNYLAFRHYYRHAYSFFLRWEELRELVLPLTAVWDQTKAVLHQFAASLLDGSPEGERPYLILVVGHPGHERVRWNKYRYRFAFVVCSPLARLTICSLFPLANSIDSS